MIDNDTSRLSRLTAILTQLQTKRLLTSTFLAEKFGVSVRTIYRDIRALEQSGVPIVTEEGKGYSLLEGYRLPPVSFTESEANALITAEKIIVKNRDASLVKEYTTAIEKIKAVLRHTTRANTELLSNRMLVTHNYTEDASSTYLASLQLALTNFNLTKIAYQKPDSGEITTRVVEPFALLSTQGNWLLVAWCRLRTGFRLFRLDRITQLAVLSEKFEPHKMTLQEYFERTSHP
ncbi:YafY family transcriptional regulator [Larkinella rosea]|uniref:YafY family transcriptional regulator n=2 Tax=Larkinella rosea TaxID=2025312 RepID=A0A3P1BPX5_9BACT|nr:YafY family transcriptional regulator [Larkinella rosea]